MRIISGKFKGHGLISFKAGHIRPTTDRVKETLFNIVPYEMTDAFVLDLFCGTGNLGIEALSRGAKKVYFVDQQLESLKITRKNLEQLKVPENSYSIFHQSTFLFLEKYQEGPFDLILADPPFTEKIAHDVMEATDRSWAFGHDTIMAIESSSRERIEDKYPTLERYNYREFGDKILSFFRKRKEERT